MNRPVFDGYLAGLIKYLFFLAKFQIMASYNCASCERGYVSLKRAVNQQKKTAVSSFKEGSRSTQRETYFGQKVLPVSPTYRLQLSVFKRYSQSAPMRVAAFCILPHNKPQLRKLKKGTLLIKPTERH